MFSLNKGRSLASFQKQTRVSRITILKRFFFAKPASKIIFPTIIIFLFIRLGQVLRNLRKKGQPIRVGNPPVKFLSVINFTSTCYSSVSRFVATQLLKQRL